jgi:hypothetical protein
MLNPFKIIFQLLEKKKLVFFVIIVGLLIISNLLWTHFSNKKTYLRSKLLDFLKIGELNMKKYIKDIL